jgi:DNA-binding transcriptional LysR family regulator
MDVELARTFLEVLRCSSFIRAARALNVTQTAVTSRIKNLESQLGCRLLTRNRKGVEPTRQGERFAGYAKNMLQLWERAQHEVPMAETAGSTLQIGGELSLWNPLLLDWLLWMRNNLPDTAIRAGVELPASLVQKVLQQIIDIAVVYTPHYHPQLQVELLMHESLIMVSAGGDHGLDPEYVNVDWGPEFAAQHDQAFPELRQSGLSIGLGPLALHYILKAGGQGYFRTRAAQPYLESGQLQRVANAPEFTYPVYVVYAAGRDEPHIETAVRGLKSIVGSLGKNWAD